MIGASCKVLHQAAGHLRCVIIEVCVLSYLMAISRGRRYVGHVLGFRSPKKKINAK